MLVKALFILALSPLALACSDDTKAATPGTEASSVADAATDDDALIAPPELTVTAHPGGCGELSLQALTLSRGPNNAELYVALKNEGKAPACSPAFSVQVFDKAEQTLATGLGGLLVQRFYRLADGSGTTAACVGPGDVTMAAITDLPSDLSFEDVGRVEYWCTFWSLDVVEIGGINISDVHPVARETGVAFAGVLENGLEVAVPSPSVAVFPLNRAGRPLGVALASRMVEVPAGGRWDFETRTVTDAGVALAAYPAGGS